MQLNYLMKFLLISLFLFFSRSLFAQAQIEWTEFSIHILNSKLDQRELCVNFPNQQSFNLVEFDRLVEGIVCIKIDDGFEILTHCGEAINAVQQYQVQFTTNKVCIQYSTNDDFWILFQISNKE